MRFPAPLSECSIPCLAKPRQGDPKQRKSSQAAAEYDYVLGNEGHILRTLGHETVTASCETELQIAPSGGKPATDTPLVVSLPSFLSLFIHRLRSGQSQHLIFAPPEIVANLSCTPTSDAFLSRFWAARSGTAWRGVRVFIFSIHGRAIIYQRYGVSRLAETPRCSSGYLH